MAENLPPAQEAGIEPFPSFTSLPHGHPATSFSSISSKADLDRQAMPPPPHPACAAPNLNASTPVFEPHGLPPFRLCSETIEKRDAWLNGVAAQFHALVVETGKCLQSLKAATSLELEMSIIEKAIGINEDGHRLYAHVINGLVGLGGPEDIEHGLVTTEWHKFMTDEFLADAQRVERCGRDLNNRKMIVHVQMVCKEKMSQYPNLSAADIMAWIQGVVGTVGAAVIPKSGGVPEPVYNQVFQPQTNTQPQFSGVAWPQQDPLEAARRLSGQQQRTPQRTLAAAFPLEGAPHQSAFAYQMGIVSSPTPMPFGTYRRNDSFGRNAQGFRQEFQAAIQAGRYDREKERRPTNASQVSFNAYARSHSFESSSSNGQRRPYLTAQNEWQEGNFRAGARSQGSSSSQSPSRRIAGVGHEEFPKLNKGKDRETSPSKHRSRSPEKYRGRQDSRSPAKKQPRPARQDDLGDNSSQAGAAADHSHPSFNAGSGPPSQDIDTVTTWSQLHTPRPSDRMRADDSDVPTLKLDDPTFGEASKTSFNVSQSTSSEDYDQQQSQSKKPALVAKQEAVSTDALEAPKEQHVASKRGSGSKRKQTTGEQSGDKSSRSSSDATTVPTTTSLEGPPHKLEHTDDGVVGEPLKRKGSNDWQVAQSRRQHKEPAPKASSKNRNQPGKGQPFKPEESSRQKKPKQVKGKGTGHEREVSNRGEKKPREKQGTASARTHAHDANQSVDGAEGGKGKSQSKNPSKNGKEKDSLEPSPESYMDKQPHLKDSTETAFPCLPTPATPSTNKNEVQPSMSWTAALKSAAHRKEAEKLRSAAETDLPMSSDAVLVRRPAVLEIIVSALFTSTPNAPTCASAASGLWQAEHILTSQKQETPRPKVKVSSGELRATATPFTPPATGESLLCVGTLGSDVTPVTNNNPLIPTYAQRAAAASAREAEAAAVTAEQTKNAGQASAKPAPGKPSTKKTRTGRNGNLKSTDSYPDLASKFQQKGGNKLDLADHGGSMSVPTSIAGSVSSPSMSSVKSLPATPMVSTWAQRAASASKLVAPPVPAMKPKHETEAPSKRPPAPRTSTEPPRKPYKLAPDFTPKQYRPAPALPDCSQKTSCPWTSTASGKEPERSLSYAYKLASPAPPVMTPLADDASKKGDKTTSAKDGKTDASKSAGVSAPGKGKKKGSKSKVCDPQKSEIAVDDNSSLGETRSQGESADASADSESKADERVGISEQRAAKAAHAHGEDGHRGEAGSTAEGNPNNGGLHADDDGRSAGAGDCKDNGGELSVCEHKATLTQGEEEGFAAEAVSTSEEGSLMEGSDDSQATVGSKARKRGSKARRNRREIRIAEERRASSVAEAAALQTDKTKELKEEKSNTETTPTKISWADDDEDEWAGFETLQETTPEVKKDGKDRKGG